MSLDLHNNIKVTQVSHAAATGGTVNSTAVDTANFGSLEFLVSVQPSTATTPTYSFEVQEGSTSTPTEAVADADLIGLESAMALTGSGGGAVKIGYKGVKRYVRLSCVSTVATGTISVVAVQSNPRVAPQS